MVDTQTDSLCTYQNHIETFQQSDSMDSETPSKDDCTESTKISGDVDESSDSTLSQKNDQTDMETVGKQKEETEKMEMETIFEKIENGKEDSDQDKTDIENSEPETIPVIKEKDSIEQNTDENVEDTNDNPKEKVDEARNNNEKIVEKEHEATKESKNEATEESKKTATEESKNEATEENKNEAPEENKNEAPEENKNKCPGEKNNEESEKKKDAAENQGHNVEENKDDKTMETEENANVTKSTIMEDTNNEDDEDEDGYFNPLLLCPEVSMDIDESPVITNTDPIPVDDISNALYTPMFSTFVDEMTGAEISFNLSAEEQELRGRLYGPNNPIEYSKVHCTACNVHLGSALAGQTNRFVHPLLKVLICKECYHFYTSGEFEKDEDGSELYCRWCGQGGQVLCCSLCEYVFCKKCIRINFGRKKLSEVRDSDEWNCFRCDPSQLKALRAMCVEFFEYVRRETARALTLNDPEFMNRDLCNCCQTYVKKRLGETEPEAEKEKKPKRKKTDVDPDYNPFVEEAEEVISRLSPIPSTSGTSGVITTILNKNPSKILPKPPTPVAGSAAPTTASPVPNEVRFVGQSPTPTVRIGNTIINVNNTPVRSPAVAIRSPNVAIRSPAASPRPRQQFTPRTNNQSTRMTGPGFITVVPPPLRQIRPSQTTSNMSNQSNFQKPVQPTIKHEWFEKTVRAAARVNSNLSYTLTQLNKAQATAASVEQLAVVHNKLQEILSSSINSLIQIRKNLRTEFIAGIKTIRFPPKPIDPNDDDVIFVNPTSEATKTTTTLTTVPPLSQITITKTAVSTAGAKKSPMVVSHKPFLNHAVTKTVTILNKSMNNNSKPVNNVTTPTSSNASPKYLKVKSFSQLQTVSSECITIPDDEPPKFKSEKSDDEPGFLTKSLISNREEKDPLANDSDDDKGSGDVSIVTATTNTVTTSNTPRRTNTFTTTTALASTDTNASSTEVPSSGITDDGLSNDKNGANAATKASTKDETVPEKEIKKEPEDILYNIKDNPSPKIKRMLSVKVNLKKSNIVEDLVKKEPLETNGDPQ